MPGSRLTPARQRNCVSEGIALGLLLSGTNHLRSDKLLVDGAFEIAWRAWPYRERFPQVTHDLNMGGSGMYIMSHADERKQVWVLFWGERDMAIYARQADWDIAEEEDLAYAQRMIDGDVPIDGWTDLARRFLDHYDRYDRSRED